MTPGLIPAHTPDGVFPTTTPGLGASPKRGECVCFMKNHVHPSRPECLEEAEENLHILKCTFF